ncbi:MAG: hypothetical protein ACREVK_03725 [Gammaproteobacteria bacterium]
MPTWAFYRGLEASDYQQVQSYLTGEYGRLAFVVTRDGTVDLYANKDVEWVREMYTNHRVLIIKLTAKFFTNLLQKLRNPQKHDTVNNALHRLLDTYTRLYLGGQTTFQTGTRKRERRGRRKPAYGGTIFIGFRQVSPFGNARLAFSH